MKKIRNLILLIFLSLFSTSILLANTYHPKIEKEPRDTPRYTKQQVKDFLNQIYEFNKDKLPKRITYSKEEEERVQDKIEQLNKYKKDPKIANQYDYQTFFTKREKQIRLEILRKLYPIDWYVDMFDLIKFHREEHCDAEYINLVDFRCNHWKFISYLNRKQIISILIHYDTLSYYYSYHLGDFIYQILIFNNLYRSIGNNLNNLDCCYSKNETSGREILELIKSRIILTDFIIQSKELLNNKINKILNN